MSKYQLLPSLNDDDYAALKADIAKRGVIVAVEYDEDGEIIDGFHRVKICKELKINDWPRIVRSYADDAAKRTQARRLNIARRHLDSKTKRKLIEAELKDNPDRSDRQVAAELGVDHKTVAKVRKKPGGEIPHQKTRKDKRGRKQPATKPKRKRKSKTEEITPLFDNPNLNEIVECANELSVRLRKLIPKLDIEERKELFLRLRHTLTELEAIGEKL